MGLYTNKRQSPDWTLYVSVLEPPVDVLYGSDSHNGLLLPLAILCTELWVISVQSAHNRPIKVSYFVFIKMLTMLFSTFANLVNTEGCCNTASNSYITLRPLRPYVWLVSHVSSGRPSWQANGFETIKPQIGISFAWFCPLRTALMSAWRHKPPVQKFGAPRIR